MQPGCVTLSTWIGLHDDWRYEAGKVEAKWLPDSAEYALRVTAADGVARTQRWRPRASRLKLPRPLAFGALALEKPEDGLWLQRLRIGERLTTMVSLVRKGKVVDYTYVDPARPAPWPMTALSLVLTPFTVALDLATFPFQIVYLVAGFQM